MSQQPDSLIGRQFAGYRLSALIEVGGMAKVYLAQDPELEREVAIKLVSGPQASDGAFVKRFRDEAVTQESQPRLLPLIGELGDFRILSTGERASTASLAAAMESSHRDFEVAPTVKEASMGNHEESYLPAPTAFESGPG